MISSLQNAGKKINHYDLRRERLPRVALQKQLNLSQRRLEFLGETWPLAEVAEVSGPMDDAFFKTISKTGGKNSRNIL